MNFKNIENYLKKNYKFIIIICLFLFLIMDDKENFSTTDALNAVKSTEQKVNGIVSKVDGTHVKFSKQVHLDKGLKSGSMIFGPKSASGWKDYGISVPGGKHFGIHAPGSGTTVLHVDNQINTHKIEATGDVKAKRFCIGGTCIDENRLKVLAGTRHFFIRAINKKGILSDHGTAKFQGNKKAWEQMKIEL